MNVFMIIEKDIKFMIKKKDFNYLILILININHI